MSRVIAHGGSIAASVAEWDVSFFEALVLGLVQGLTEFLPISSSGHLRLIPALAGWDDPGAGFTAVTQLGTLVAVLIYFRHELWSIASSWTRALWTPAMRRQPEVRLGWYLVVATVPLVIGGLLFSDQIENGARDLRLGAWMLIIFGVVLGVADRFGSRRYTMDDLNGRRGILIGLSQALALIPGVSRSGATISAGLFVGFTRQDAARFSFLLSVPAVALSGVYQLPDIGEGLGPGLVPTLVATVVAFGAAYATIAWLLRWLANHTMTPFVVYRVGLGVVLLVLIGTGFVDAT